MLKLVDIACQRGKQKLWSNVNASIEAGHILFVAGTNGSGKSSLLRIIAGLSTPIEGQVLWNTQEISKNSAIYRQEMIYIGHQAPLKPEFSSIENLEALMQLHGIQNTKKELKTALHYWGLNEKTILLPSKQLSQGQKQRTTLAQLSLLKKKVWILDEPFNSLDQIGTELLSKLLEAHLLEKGIVIITSHLHLDAEQINDGFKNISLKLKL